MSLDVHLHRLARFTEIVINAIRAAVSDTLDGHGTAAVASDPTMNVAVSPRLILGDVIEQIQQILALARRRGIIISIPP
jgi:hypothetical protein